MPHEGIVLNFKGFFFFFFVIWLIISKRNPIVFIPFMHICQHRDVHVLTKKRHPHVSSALCLYVYVIYIYIYVSMHNCSAD